MHTMTRARSRASRRVAGAALALAAAGCGARSGLLTEGIEGTSAEITGGVPGSPDAASPECSAMATPNACTAAPYCDLCGSFGPTGDSWICADNDKTIIFVDDAGNELGQCGDVDPLNPVTGPVHRF